jgi:hypothetical protein
MVAAIDQRDVDRRVAQAPHGPQAGEATSDDHDSFLLHAENLAETRRVRRAKMFSALSQKFS